MPTLKKSILQYLLLLLAVCSAGSVQAQSDRLEGYWFNDKKDARIQIYKAKDGKFYGKIVWLKEPNRNGKLKMDDNNPKEQLQKQPLVGLVILKGFEKDGDTYEEGTIYDPENGKTYDCKMTLKGKTVSIRGYIGVSWLGRTTVWERAG